MKCKNRKTQLAVHLSIFMLLLAAISARAQDSEPTLLSDADYTFGQSIQFRLSAKNIPDIETVTLFFKAPEFPNTFTVDVPFESGATIRVVHPVDLSQIRLAPFTRVTYWWKLTAVTGEAIDVPEQIIPYDDNRFEWRQYSRHGVTAYWTGEDPVIGQLALNIVEETYPRLQSIYSDFQPQPFQLFVYPSTADLRSALRLTGRDWVGAHADPLLGVVLVAAVNARTAAADLGQSVPHEMAHLMLHQVVGEGYDSVSQWFSEGIASYAEPMPRPEYRLALQQAIAEQNTIPFKDLCHAFPSVQERAILAYAQSVSMIRYIQAHHGNQKIADLTQSFADGADCESSVSRVLDMTLAELEHAWISDQEPQSAVSNFITDNGLWMLIIAGGFVVSLLLNVGPSRRKTAKA